MWKVDAADIGFHLPRNGFHTHKARTQERLVITDAIHRRHYGVDVSVIGKDRHLSGCAERLADLGLRCSCLFQYAITLTLPHRSVHNCTYLLSSQLISERRIGLSPVFFRKFGLQKFSYVAIDSFFGIALHSRVDGGINFQSVGVKIIRIAVFLEIFIAPATQRVCGPSNRIDNVLSFVPDRIIRSIGALHHHIAAQKFAKERGNTILMISTVKVQCQRLCTVLAIFSIGKISCFYHLCQNNISTLNTPCGITNGIEKRGGFAQTNQCSRLSYRQIFGFFIKISISCRLDTDGIM